MENLIAGNCNWDVVEVPLYLGESGLKSTTAKGLIRSDNGKELGTVSDTYKPISNKSFFNTITEIAKISGYEYMGYAELYGGNRLLSWLKMPEKKKLRGYDTESYLMFGTSHDGKTPMLVGTSNRMIRCNNQFTALHKGNIFKITHTKTSGEKVDRLAQSFANYQKTANILYENIERFSDIKLTKNKINEMVKLLATDKKERQKTTPYIERVMADMHLCIESECADLGNDLFGVWNGLTKYTTHYANNHRGLDAGFANSYGKMAKMNTMALEMCMEMLGKAPKNYSLQ